MKFLFKVVKSTNWNSLFVKRSVQKWTVITSRFLKGLGISKMSEKTLKIMFVWVAFPRQRKFLIFMQRCTFSAFLQIQNINQHWYLEVLTQLREKILMKKKTRIVRDQFPWVLHQDNVPGHIALPVKTFRSKFNILVLDHPLYLLDMAQYGFCIFLNAKSALKGIRFQTTKDVIEKSGTRHKRARRRKLPALFQTMKILYEPP